MNFSFPLYQYRNPHNLIYKKSLFKKSFQIIKSQDKIKKVRLGSDIIKNNIRIAPNLSLSLSTYLLISKSLSYPAPALLHPSILCHFPNLIKNWYDF